MANCPARFTTADLRRALKAAEQAGPEWFVDVLPDGTIRMKQGVPEKPPERRERIVLYPGSGRLGPSTALMPVDG